MSDENILSIEEEPSGQSQPLAVAVDQPEDREAWERELLDGASRLFRDTLSPISGGIESLRQSIQVIADSLDTLRPESTLTSDLDKLVASVRAAFFDSSQKAAETHQQQLLAEREEWAAELKRRVEETRDEIQREAEQRIGELERQVSAGREALELAVRSAAKAEDPPEPRPVKDETSAGTDRKQDLKLAIDDINAQRSQADTLSSLVQHAERFAPRVLFFVVRGGLANGWKAGGFSRGLNDETVKTLSIPVDENSLIGRALLSFEPELGGEVEGVLGGLASPPSAEALAVPLVVRGRSAAVLYADNGDMTEKDLDTTSLEILMRVTAMAIELLPTRRGEPNAVSTAKPGSQANEGARGTMPLPKPSPRTPDPAVSTIPAPVSTHDAPSSSTPEQMTGRPPGGETRELQTFSGGLTDAAPDAVPPMSYSPAAGDGAGQNTVAAAEPATAPTEHDNFATNTYDHALSPGAPSPSALSPNVSETSVDASWPVSKPVSDTSDLEVSPERITKPVPGFERASRLSGDVASPPVTAPQSTESEQRAHNDARRFARLLVSEIKLYNGAKVGEGRRNYDLYSRLSEEIDRSRKVYDKRVSPAVAARFDYFYDELVQTLADGDREKLGVDCPGPQLRQ